MATEFRSMSLYRKLIVAGLLALLLRTPLLSAQSSAADLLLLHGRILTVDARDSVAHAIAIRRGIIVKVGSDVEVLEFAGSLPGTRIIDLHGHTATPGLIDTHAHVYQHVSGRFGLNADLCGVQSGVTALVDQGGPSNMTFPGFREFIAKRAATRVYAFISAYVVGGLEGHYYPDLYGPTGVDVKACIEAAEANRDIVKGIKAHAEIGGYKRWGNVVMKKAQRGAA